MIMFRTSGVYSFTSMLKSTACKSYLKNECYDY